MTVINLNLKFFLVCVSKLTKFIFYMIFESAKEALTLFQSGSLRGGEGETPDHKLKGIKLKKY